MLALAGCGAKQEPGADGASGSGGSSERPTLNGCLKLWNNGGDAHVGSTAVREVAKGTTVYAKVEIRGNRCHVAYATRALTNSGSYVQRDTAYGPFALDHASLSKRQASRLVRSANAKGQVDGTLAPGPPG